MEHGRPARQAQTFSDGRDARSPSDLPYAIVLWFTYCLHD
jgi:hypothetical protein